MIIMQYEQSCTLYWNLSNTHCHTPWLDRSKSASYGPDMYKILLRSFYNLLRSSASWSFAYCNEPLHIKEWVVLMGMAQDSNLIIPASSLRDQGPQESSVVFGVSHPIKLRKKWTGLNISQDNRRRLTHQNMRLALQPPKRSEPTWTSGSVHCVH